ncbi:hypothetical protein [Streptomyces mirabilis]
MARPGHRRTVVDHPVRHARALPLDLSLEVAARAVDVREPGEGPYFAACRPNTGMAMPSVPRPPDAVS